MLNKMRAMKNTFWILLLFIFACNAPQTEETAWPEDVDGKKELLQKKNTDLSALQAEIKKLKDEIAELNPNQAVLDKLVTTINLKRSDFTRFVEIQGNVESKESVMASSEVGGRIIRLNAEEGRPIRRGQLVAKIDLESIDKQIAEIKTSLDLANDLYNRQKRLWDQNIGSEVQFLQAKNNKERLEKSLETLAFQQTKANVYAPISGVVNMIFAEQGEMAGPGAPIIEILDTRKIKVVAAVPETYLKAIKKGANVKVKFPALDLEKEAKISMISNTINPANRTFKIEVNMVNNNGLLKPNLLAIMMVSDFSQNDVVTVPVEVVQQEINGNDYVMIAQPDNDGWQAQKVYVQTGESYEGNVIITEGLKGDEKLIMEGSRGLVDLEPIRVNELSEVQATNE